ncbi:YdbC family protein [Jeotgalibaca caeni]|uniref:YdbC family protein n=1 Tax=Jeotgalibaca caeni TaxID=3028623 RepID=UPI00237DBB43|nr:PC4/YdbC family ssDNA-binding protein [Jeotgalibaca caeni]MDE1549900.1 PC4/YdbC family ssDNA-binding protein [Jeotgalibaca caeni]
MAEVNFEIVNHIGVLSTSKNGWTKELNVVSWNGGQPKYDIREWNEDHTKMSKGITMNEEEIGQLRLLIIQ